MQVPLQIGEVEVRPGQRVTIDLPVTRLHTHIETTMPVQVIHSTRPGPRLFISAVVHGDEINGVEIIRRLLKLKLLNQLSGTLMVVPVVNAFGFIGRSRYLPDRRDLNRIFPGSPTGSLAARLADLFMREIVANATHGIDLHTGSNHRTNLPQVRAYLNDFETERLARAFGAPVILNANLQAGSLRQAAVTKGVCTLLYEGGEALRFDELAIRTGVRGIVAVMRAIKMLPTNPRSKLILEPVVARRRRWIRAPGSGVLRTAVTLGARVAKGEVLGSIADPFGENEIDVRSSISGIVIGRINMPLVNEGEALFHVARFENPQNADKTLALFRTSFNQFLEQQTK